MDKDSQKVGEFQTVDGLIVVSKNTKRQTISIFDHSDASVLVLTRDNVNKLIELLQCAYKEVE